MIYVTRNIYTRTYTGDSLRPEILEEDNPPCSQSASEPQQPQLRGKVFTIGVRPPHAPLRGRAEGAERDAPGSRRLPRRSLCRRRPHSRGLSAAPRSGPAGAALGGGGRGASSGAAGRRAAARRGGLMPCPRGAEVPAALGRLRRRLCGSPSGPGDGGTEERRVQRAVRGAAADDSRAAPLRPLRCSLHLPLR